jgi:positive regulator of sigma E activity
MKTIKTQPDCSLDDIRHDGIIKSVESEVVNVSIVSKSACAACHAKGVCNVSELNEQVLEIPRVKGETYKVGAHVQVSMHKTLGMRAVFLGYILPFLLLLTTLIISFSLLKNDGLAGVMSLAILVPYYAILYRFRDHFRRTFRFRIG